MCNLFKHVTDFACFALVSDQDQFSIPIYLKKGLSLQTFSFNANEKAISVGTSAVVLQTVFREHFIDDGC